MGFKIYVAEIPAPSTVNKVKSLEFTLPKTEGNRFRIRRIFAAVPNRDAEATGDLLGFQISTKQQNEAAALLSMIDDDTIFTYQEEHEALGTNGASVNREDITKCKMIPQYHDIVLETGKRLYLSALITGQDGADCAMELRMLCQYENAKDEGSAQDWYHNSLGS